MRPYTMWLRTGLPFWCRLPAGAGPLRGWGARVGCCPVRFPAFGFLRPWGSHVKIHCCLPGAASAFDVALPARLALGVFPPWGLVGWWSWWVGLGWFPPLPNVSAGSGPFRPADAFSAGATRRAGSLAALPPRAAAGSHGVSGIIQSS